MGFAADDIEQGRFAGAVRPDHDAQLVVMHAEVTVVQRLEAVVVHDDVLALQNQLGGVHVTAPPGRGTGGRASGGPGSVGPGAAAASVRLNSLRMMPTSPSGNSVTTTTKRPPKINGQASGK